MYNIGLGFTLGNSEDKKKKVMFDRYIESMVLPVKCWGLKKMLSVIKSMYNNIRTCVTDNGKLSWFCTRFNAGRSHFYNNLFYSIFMWMTLRFSFPFLSVYNMTFYLSNMFSLMHGDNMESILRECKHFWMKQLTKMIFKKAVSIDRWSWILELILAKAMQLFK